MPRLARAIAIGCAHHVTQRGNNRQPVFLVDEDRQVYLELLQEQADKYGLEILTYCLMDNHVHLVAIPHEEDALAKAIGRTHLRYTQYFNRFHQRSGHLWQGRFSSCALDGRHLWLALKYVELNPLRAKLCRRARQYAWSSAAAHTDEKAESELLNLPRWYKRMSAEQWRKELAEGLTDSEVARIRLRTHTGRPLGSDSFLSKLETLLGGIPGTPYLFQSGTEYVIPRFPTRNARCLVGLKVAFLAFRVPAERGKRPNSGDALLISQRELGGTSRGRPCTGL